MRAVRTGKAGFRPVPVLTGSLRANVSPAQWQATGPPASRTQSRRWPGTCRRSGCQAFVRVPEPVPRSVVHCRRCQRSPNATRRFRDDADVSRSGGDRLPRQGSGRRRLRFSPSRLSWASAHFSRSRRSPRSLGAVVDDLPREVVDLRKFLRLTGVDMLMQCLGHVHHGRPRPTREGAARPSARESAEVTWVLSASNTLEGGWTSLSRPERRRRLAVRRLAPMRRAFAHEAVLVMDLGADVNALGAAVTVALCGHWEHDPPCPLAAHYSHAERSDSDAVHLRVLFAAEPDREGTVRELIDSALMAGALAGSHDLEPVRWRLLSSNATPVKDDERAHAERLSQT